MVKEGYWYGLPLLLVAGGAMGLRLYVPGVLFLIIAVLVLNFFRDPERKIPTEPNAIVAPADGRVVEVRDEAFDGETMRRVSIFMSPLDVHVNRAPIAGTIGAVTYRKGSFRVASQSQASLENEQNVFTINGEQGRVVVKQIAGLLARRIVFWKKTDDLTERGERIGLIKFGSRVNLLMEPEVELRIRVGDHVQAGSSDRSRVSPKRVRALGINVGIPRAPMSRRTSTGPLQPKFQAEEKGAFPPRRVLASQLVHGGDAGVRIHRYHFDAESDGHRWRPSAVGFRYRRQSDWMGHCFRRP